jgi:uncharacterized protein YkwD
MRRWHLNTFLVICLAIILILLLAGGDPLHWGPRGEAVNSFRAAHDRHQLDQQAELQQNADDRSAVLAGRGMLVHAEGVNENIGTGPDYDTIFAAWKQSSCKWWGSWYPKPCPGHRELLLDRDFTRMGIGCTRDITGRLWCVLRLR